MTALIELPSAPVTPADFSHDDLLFHLQLRIARRADELARQIRSNRKDDRKWWEQAEREVMDATSLERAVSAPTA